MGATGKERFHTVTELINQPRNTLAEVEDLLEGTWVGTFWDLNQLFGCQLIPLKTISYTTPTLYRQLEKLTVCGNNSFVSFTAVKVHYC